MSRSHQGALSASEGTRTTKPPCKRHSVSQSARLGEGAVALLPGRDSLGWHLAEPTRPPRRWLPSGSGLYSLGHITYQDPDHRQLPSLPLVLVPASLCLTPRTLENVSTGGVAQILPRS